MKAVIYLLAALLLGTALVALYSKMSAVNNTISSPAGSGRPELEYLKAVNSVAPPQDPQLLFLLMAQYAIANLQDAGAEFFSARLKEFGPRLRDAQKALYLSIIGLLRDQLASDLSL